MRINITDVLTARAEATLFNLLVNIAFEGFREGDIHGTYGRSVAGLAIFGKAEQLWQLAFEFMFYRRAHYQGAAAMSVCSHGSRVQPTR